MLALFVIALLGVVSSIPVDNNNQYLPPPGVEAKSATSGQEPKYKIIPIVKSLLENPGDGSYSYSYETANSITAEEKGTANDQGTRSQGSYSFTLPDGQKVSVTYTADENGFVAQGSHIPTAGPIPEAIQKALEENAAAEARGIFDDGQYHGEGLEESQYKEEPINSEGYKY